MILDDFNEVIDPLYGPISIDPFLRKLILKPEVQRLREVRLSNINSLLVTGISNLSRFEHSLGTAYLAQRLCKRLRLSTKDSLVLMCAALLHDVSITPFGHLMEEGFRYSGIPFDHEGKLYEIIVGDAEKEIGTSDFQIYKGKSIGFKKILDQKHYRDLEINFTEIFECIKGKTLLGELLNGTMDIDNIDNVCRMAFHLGLPFRKELPIEIVDNFSIHNSKIFFPRKKEDLLTEWLSLREGLYNVLMTNPIDFVAKAMLIEAIRIGLKGNDNTEAKLDESDWKLTDAGLVDKLEKYELTKNIMTRLATADYYNLIGLFWVSVQNFKGFDHTKVIEIRTSLAEKVNVKFEDLIVYVIKDKRYRQLKNINFLEDIKSTENSSEKIKEKAQNNILIGIASSNNSISDKIHRELFRGRIKEIFQVKDVLDCDSVQHLKNAFTNSTTQKSIAQETLF